MANPEHVAVVKQGAKAIAEWREKNLEVLLDLTGADFSDTNLAHADLARANLSGANLFGANLSAANLRGAYFTGTDLRQVNLNGANLSLAAFGGTSIGMCDLNQCTGLESVRHHGPSSIGVDALIASFRGAGSQWTPELETFFRGAGVPDELLRALPDVVRDIRYYTCFIGYGEPDRAFAETLYSDLLAKGVSCWLFSKDATPGERSRKEIAERRRTAEKMIVLCSAKAFLDSDNFKNEVEDQIDEDREKIVPVSLDDIWTKPAFPGHAWGV